MSEPVQVLFVCLGNICRSPTAQGVFEQLVKVEGYDQRIVADSAGTGDWHLGKAPDLRAQEAALSKGYDIGHLRARQVTPGDFERFDYILAMDLSNLHNLSRMKPAWYSGHLGLFLEFADGVDHLEVPDPYYGEEDGFEQVLSLVHAAAQGLLDHIRREHLSSPQQ